MNDEPCVIQINGTNYYAACNVLDNIVFDETNNRLINTSGSSIVVYYDYPQLNDNYSGYPRIQANANQVFYYRNSYNGNNQSLTVNSYEVINRHTSNDFLLMVVLIGVMIINLFKR